MGWRSAPCWSGSVRLGWPAWLRTLMRCEDLTRSELLVWKAFPGGEVVDLRSGDPGMDDPSNGRSWDSSRVIRSEVIRAILLGACEPELGGGGGLANRGGTHLGVSRPCPC